MDTSRIPKKSTGWKIQWKKTCEKTMIDKGRHQEGLLAARLINKDGGD
jgi:hypothetical protein